MYTLPKSFSMISIVNNLPNIPKNEMIYTWINRTLQQITLHDEKRFILDSGLRTSEMFQDKLCWSHHFWKMCIQIIISTLCIAWSESLWFANKDTSGRWRPFLVSANGSVPSGNNDMTNVPDRQLRHAHVSFVRRVVVWKKHGEQNKRGHNWVQGASCTR